jgi:hypothetical protein
MITLGAVAVTVALVVVIFNISHGNNTGPIAIPSGPIASLSLPPAVPPLVPPVPGPTGSPLGPLPTFPGTPGAVTGRITDPIAGLSYDRFAAPWQPLVPTTLGADYTAGESLVTETDSTGSGHWYAAIGSMPLSAELLGSSPNSALDLRTVTYQESVLLAQSSYPAASTRTELADQSITVSGRKAWLIGFHESFTAPGYMVRGEIGVVVVVATGGPEPGVLFASIPDTRKELLPTATVAIKSLQVA